MRQNLISHTVYQDLAAAGVPPSVAVRVAALVGGRMPVFLDHRSVACDDAAHVQQHDVVVMTARRVIQVRAFENTPERTQTVGARFSFHIAAVWSRDRVVAVSAEGDEVAWDVLLMDPEDGADVPVEGLRQYVLTFDGRAESLIIPLSPAKQDDADEIAACMAYEVK